MRQQQYIAARRNSQESESDKGCILRSNAAKVISSKPRFRELEALRGHRISCERPSLIGRCFFSLFGEIDNAPLLTRVLRFPSQEREEIGEIGESSAIVPLSITQKGKQKSSEVPLSITQRSSESGHQVPLQITQRGRKRSSESDINVYDLSNMPTPINTIKRRKICIGTRNTYNVKIDLRRHPALRSYCRLICELQIHHVEEVSQRARHSIAMLRWSVVNCEIFMQAGWNGNHRINTISTPRIRIKLASAAFKQHPMEK
ncbi:1621_t:CDS:2, partial [Gigaspora rosea]